MASTTPVYDVIPYRQDIAAAGAQQFTFNWWIGKAEDLEVYKDGVLVSPTAYTVTGIQEPAGGIIVFTIPMVGGEVITLSGDFDIERLTGYLPGGPFRAGAINLELSTIVAILLQLQRNINRKVGFTLAQKIDAGADIFPTPVVSNALVWATTGGKLKNVPFPENIGDLQALVDTAIEQAAIATAQAEIATEQAEATITIPSNSAIQSSGPGVQITRPLKDWVCPFHVEAFGEGAVATETMPDAETMTRNVVAFQAAFDAAAAFGGGRVVAGNGVTANTYFFNDTLIYDPSVTGFDGHGCELNGSALTSETAKDFILVRHSYNVGTNYRHAQWEFTSCRVVGPSTRDVDGVQVFYPVSGFAFDSTAANKSSRSMIRAVRILGFEKAFDYRNRAYIINLENVSSSNNRYHNYMGPGYADYGENITMHACKFFNGGENYWNYPNCSVFYNNCSIDYNKADGWINAVNATVWFTNCHLEDRHTEGMITPPIKAGASNGCYINFTGCRFLMLGGIPHTTIDAIVDAGLGSFVDFVDCHMHTLQTNTDIFKKGLGRCRARGTRGYGNNGGNVLLAGIEDKYANLMGDGGFENATITDLIYIVGDRAPITNKFTGTNIRLTITTDQAYSGTQCLKYEKLTGAIGAGSGLNDATNGTAKFEIAMPLRPGGDTHSAQYRHRNPTGVGGNAFRGVNFRQLIGYNQYGLPIWGAQSTTFTEAADTGAITDWRTQNFRPWSESGAVPDPCFTHRVANWNLDSWHAGAGYVDNIIQNAW